MSRIHEYLPETLKDVIDLKLLNEDLDIELEQLDGYITGIGKEVIVKSASLYGIQKWEKALGITPKDGDSLETRRFRVNNLLTSKLPYTYRWLIKKLTQITGSPSGYTLNINQDDYAITIVLSGLDTNMMIEVQKQLRNAIPSNMVLEIGGPPLVSADIKVGMALRIGTKYKIPSGYGNGGSPIAIGKNKLPNFMQSTEDSGVTFTVQNDKSIHCVGTAQHRIEPILYQKSFTLPAGTYKYTGELLLIMPRKAGGYITAGHGGKIILNQQETLLSAYFRVENGTEIDLVYHPQIIVSGEDESYEPFNGI